MEDTLDVYTLPPDEDVTFVCIDEQPVQLLEDRYKAVKMKPGRPKKEDSVLFYPGFPRYTTIFY